MIRGAAMIRFTGRLLLAARFGLVAIVFATTVLVAPMFAGALFDGGELAQAASGEPEIKTSADTGDLNPATEEGPADGQASEDEGGRSFAPVETDPDPLPGNRLPLEMRTGESPFLSDSFQRRIALGVLLVFAVILLFTLILWRKTAEPELIETPPPADAPAYQEILAAAAERERIKQLSQRR